MRATPEQVLEALVGRPPEPGALTVGVHDLLVALTGLAENLECGDEASAAVIAQLRRAADLSMELADLLLKVGAWFEAPGGTPGELTDDGVLRWCSACGAKEVARNHAEARCWTCQREAEGGAP